MTARPTADTEPAAPGPRIDLRPGDARKVLTGLPEGCVDCVVTSPPYWGTRDYGISGQYGHEPTLDTFVEHLRAVFTELHRVLSDTGTCWLVLGDTYAGSWGNYAAPTPSRAARSRTTNARASRRRVAEGRRRAARYGTFRPPQAALPAKNLLGVPWQVALALQADGWLLRNAIVWHKPRPMPESVRDRLSHAHEYVFLLVKQAAYHFNLDAIRRPHTPASIRRAEPHRAPAGALNPGHPSRTSRRIPTARMRHPRGANPGDVWPINPTRRRDPRIHAAFPIELPRRCIAAGCPPGGTVLDPFCGSGTTGEAALETGRGFLGIDINPDCIAHTRQQLQNSDWSRDRGER